MFAVESFANVHHLVSTVTGQLAPGRGYADLLRAAFPPGSITGAPKVQAMRVIAEHDPPRGPYCGTLFWAGCDGAFDSSVLIRTAALIEDTAGGRCPSAQAPASHGRQRSRPGAVGNRSEESRRSAGRCRSRRVIPLDDRGFTLGDGVFETVAGRPLAGWSASTRIWRGWRAALRPSVCPAPDAERD
jgi:hypothetical protein